MNRPAARRRQHGAVLPIVAVSLTALLAALLLVLDSGRLYLAQRDLQNQANLAAINAARAIGGCQGEVSNPQDVASSVAKQSLSDNEADADLLNNAGSSVTLGQITTDTNKYDFVATQANQADQATAVRVRLSRPAPAVLSTILTGNPSGTLVASAAAYSEPTVGLSVSSGLLSLDPSSTPILGPLLGGLLGIPPGQLSVDLLNGGFESLANINVTLLQIIKAGAGAGSIGDFLHTPITVGGNDGLLSALGKVISQVDSSFAGPLLLDLADLADSNRIIIPDEFLDVAPDNLTQAAQLPINAAQLLMAIAQTAGQGEPIKLPVALDVDGLASANVQVRLTEPSVIALGRPGYNADGTPRTMAYSSQGLVQVNLKLDPKLDLLVVKFALDIELHLYAKLAEARAVPVALFCATVDQPYHQLVVEASTGIASLGLGVFDDINGPFPELQDTPPVINLEISALFGLIPVTNIQIQADTDSVLVGGGTTELLFEGPFAPVLDEPSPDNTQTVSTDLGSALAGTLGSLSSSLNLSIKADLLGIDLGPITKAVDGLLNLIVSTLSSVLSPIFNILDTALLKPLFTLLGLDLGTGTVTVTGVYPSKPDTRWGQEDQYLPVVILTEGSHY